MGLPKATLPFGPELMLQRVVRLLRTVVSPIVVVAAPAQPLPALPPEVLVAHDEREARGPLEGLLAGLLCASAHAEAAYATSCDVPLLVPEFVAAMIGRLQSADVAVPVEDGFPHPLAAVYRVRVVSEIRNLLAADLLRPAYLFERVPTVRVDVNDLRSVDPELMTLRNLNRPDDYLSALAALGFTAPQAIRAQLARDVGRPLA